MGKRILANAKVVSMALELANRAAMFKPEAVVCIMSGGLIPGTTIAQRLGLRLFELKLSYPLSPLLARIPKPLPIVFWPLKEMAYKLTNPSIREIKSLPHRNSRILLVDDTASSGRTLEKAMRNLVLWGFSKENIRTAVIRCGEKAKHATDYFFTDKKVFFKSD